MKRIVIAACIVLCVLILQVKYWKTTSTKTVQKSTAGRQTVHLTDVLQQAEPVIPPQKIIEQKTALKKPHVQLTVAEPACTFVATNCLTPSEINQPEVSIQEYLDTRNSPEQIVFIDPSQFNTITGEKGTMLQIPPSSFKLDDSTYYTGDVRVEMKEITNQSQMAFSNYSTTCNGQLLESAGMIYWNATTPDGQQLKMDSANNVIVTFKGARNFSGYQLFTGRKSDRGLDWQLFPSYTLYNGLAILPEERLFFPHFKIKRKVKSLPEETVNDWNDRIDQLNSGGFHSSTLCSYEFLQRLKIIRNMGWDVNLLDVYLDHPESLNAGDSLSVVQMLSYTKDIKQSNYKISRKYICLDESKRVWLKVHMRKLKSFYTDSRGLTNNISLSKKDLRSIRRMSDKLKSIDYARWVYNQPRYYSRCSGFNTAIDEKYEKLRMAQTAVIESKNNKSISLKVPAMGFINCDRFLNRPNLQNVIVKVNNMDKMDGGVYTYLVFKQLNSMMNGYSNNSGEITFVNIPAGEKVSLMVIGFSGNKTFFYEQPLTVGDVLDNAVTLTESSKEEVEQAIKKVSS